MPAVIGQPSTGFMLSQTGLPTEIFHHLGQYSPWYAPDLSSRSELPDHCAVTFVSQIERHGSRYPTGGAYKELSKTLRSIAKHLSQVSDDGASGPFEEESEKLSDTGLDASLQWLRTWTEVKKNQDGGLRNRIGNSELTPYGQYEAFASGRRFSEQYAHLFGSSEEVSVNYDFDSAGRYGDVHVSSFCASDQPLVFLNWLRCRVFNHGTRQAYKLLRSTGSFIDARPFRPFVRASGADRVVATSRFWLDGFVKPRKPFEHASPESATWPQQGRPSIIRPQKNKKPHRPLRGLPKPDVIISEARKAGKHGGTTSNNTLDVYTCSSFEREHRGNERSEAVRRVTTFAENATSLIRSRLARQLGARSQGNKARRGERMHLSPEQVLQLFSLCAFDTVARLNPYGLISNDIESNKDAMSRFCGLFHPSEFKDIYEITTNIEKDYGFASRQPFHRALATSWLRELLARLENRGPVLTPPASINVTLDTSANTFPLPAVHGPRAFVDFTHDNQLAPILAALDLWNSSRVWSTSATTPFSGRLTIEKVACSDRSGEHVRVLVNDAPARNSEGSWCPTSTQHPHLCPLDTFLAQLAWADTSTEWDRCYS